MEQYCLDDRCGVQLAAQQTMQSINFLSCPDRVPYLVNYGDKTLSVQSDEHKKRSVWHLSTQSGQLTLEWVDPDSEQPEVHELLAAIEATFVSYPHQAKLYLIAPVGQFAELFDTGVLVKVKEGQVVVYVGLFWQQARVWLSSSRSQTYPLYPVFSQGRCHPLRPPKPVGIVYQRYIPWLGRMLSFRTVNLDTDLGCFNRWMNDPVVAEFWQETGDLTRHRSYLEAIQTDPHVINLIGCLDDEPFGYFEIYWAKEDRIAHYYDVDDFDRGWHVLIGEPHLRGKPFVTAWLPSISHYLFLDDARTQRIVIEPRVDNCKMIRNLTRCGYVHLKEFNFPHKRALLGMLLRKRFFAAQLWVPHDMLLPHSMSLS